MCKKKCIIEKHTEKRNKNGSFIRKFVLMLWIFYDFNRSMRRPFNCAGEKRIKPMALSLTIHWVIKKNKCDVFRSGQSHHFGLPCNQSNKTHSSSDLHSLKSVIKIPKSSLFSLLLLLLVILCEVHNAVHLSVYLKIASNLTQWCQDAAAAADDDDRTRENVHIWCAFCAVLPHNKTEMHLIPLHAIEFYVPSGKCGNYFHITVSLVLHAIWRSTYAINSR